MKKKFLLTMITLAVSIPAFAYISSSETYSSDFLKLNGYSDTTIKVVNHERNKAAGITDETEGKVIRNWFLRRLYWFYNYTDPAAEGEQFLNHDIKIEPSANDL